MTNDEYEQEKARKLAKKKADEEYWRKDREQMRRFWDSEPERRRSQWEQAQARKRAAEKEAAK